MGLGSAPAATDVVALGAALEAGPEISAAEGKLLVLIGCVKLPGLKFVRWAFT